MRPSRVEGPQPALLDQHLQVAVDGAERDARASRGAPPRRPTPPWDATRCHHGLVDQAPLAGGAAGGGRADDDISVTIPIIETSASGCQELFDHEAVVVALPDPLQSVALVDDPPPSLRREGLPSRRARASPTRTSTARTASPISTRAFLAGLAAEEPALAARLPAYRADPASARRPRPLAPARRRRRGRSRPSWPGSSASRRSGGARRAVGRPGGRPLPVPAGLPAAARRQDEAAGGPRRVRSLARSGTSRGRSSGTSTRTCRGTRTRSSRRPGWRPGFSTSRPTSSPPSGRRRSPRCPPRSRDEARRLARRAAASGRRAPRAPERGRRGSPRSSSRSSSSSTPSGATCGASTPPSRPEVARLDVLPACPRRSTTRTSSRPKRPNPALPEERVGPARGHRRREGFTLTDPRMTPREVLGETHYCLLCHEREKDSCSKGFFDAKTVGLAEEPARHPAEGLPARREDLGDARAAARGRRDRRARAGLRSTTRCAPERATASATTA